MTRTTILGFTLLLATGCAPATNTLAQDLTWAAYAACRSRVPSNIQIERVDPDGRYWWRTSEGSYGATQLEACMREERAKRPRPQATTGATAVATSQGRTAITGPIVQPVWKVGNEWAYRYETPSGSGTFVWRLDRIEALANEPHYVITADTREIFYRVADLGFTKEILDGKTVRQISPSTWRTVAFPLSVGLSWDMKYLETRPTEQQTENLERRCVAEAEEALTVPAGTFATIRIVCNNTRNNAWVITVWYSPEVNHIVKDEYPVRTGGRTSRELLMFRLK